MKVLNYILSIIILGLLIVLISNNISNKNVRKSNISELELKDSTIKLQNNIIKQFKAEAQKVDTNIYTKFGEFKKSYYKIIKGLKDENCLLKNKTPDTIKIIDSLFRFNTKIDSINNKDLFLKYRVNTYGIFLKADFDYRVKQKEIIKTKIIYEPEFIKELVPLYTPKRSLYLYCSYGLTQTHFSTGLLYNTKKRLNFGIAYSFAKFDQNYQYFSVMVGYKIF